MGLRLRAVWREAVRRSGEDKALLPQAAAGLLFGFWVNPTPRARTRTQGLACYHHSWALSADTAKCIAGLLRSQACNSQHQYGLFRFIPSSSSPKTMLEGSVERTGGAKFSAQVWLSDVTGKCHWERSENGVVILAQFISERAHADDGGLKQREFLLEPSYMDIDGTGRPIVVVSPDRVQQHVPRPYMPWISEKTFQ